MSKKLYILDVSGFIFRAYFALPPMTNPQGEATQALYGFIRSVLKLFKDFSPEHIVAVFDGPDNKKVRQEIYEKYKSNRVRAQPDLPPQIEWAKRFCELSGIPHVEVPGVEADDTMGSIAQWAAKEGNDIYICTSDKDLGQLVGTNIFLINPWKENLIVDRKKVEELYGVPPEQIIDLLAIMGDSSDNIPGLTGFGPKTAVALLKEFGSLENLMKNIDKVSGAKKQETLKTESEMAYLSQRLATIHTDIPFEKDPSFFSPRTPELEGLKEFYQQMSFNSLLRELDTYLEKEGKKTLEEEKVRYTIVESEEKLDELLHKLSQEKEIAVDVEATSLHPLVALPVGIGLGYREGEAWYLPFNGKLDSRLLISKLKPFFENKTLRFYGHNVKYDCHVLENVGITITHLSFDTILASYLLNSHQRRHSLDHLVLHYFGKIKIPFKSLIGSGKKEIPLDQVPIAKVADYCCEDVDYTIRLKHLLEKEIDKQKMGPLLYELELPLSRVLGKMERAGIALDASFLHKMSEEIKQELLELEKEIYHLAGTTFNIASPKQLSEILFERLKIKPLKRTATGHSTSAEVLEAIAATHPIAEKIISYRVLDKLRSTYVDVLPEQIDPNTGRIHPTFTQYVAATGRLACQDPNLQNIPIRNPLGKKIREAFRPGKRGWSYLAADYSQVELRLLAHFSEDPHLIKAFKEGKDIHTHTASLIFDLPLEKVSKEQREQTKAINFGIIYGQQAYGLSQELKIDIKKAAEFIDAYFKRYPRVLGFIEACVKDAYDTGKVSTMIGRERKIPEIHSNNAVARAAAERLAINTPLQGSAADLIKIAMLKIDHALEKNKMNSFLILQIHDELIFEAPDEELPLLQKIVKEEMEGVFNLKVPLVVHLSIGKNWGQC